MGGAKDIWPQPRMWALLNTPAGWLEHRVQICAIQSQGVDEGGPMGAPGEHIGSFISARLNQGSPFLEHQEPPLQVSVHTFFSLLLWSESVVRRSHTEEPPYVQPQTLGDRGGLCLKDLMN